MVPHLLPDQAQLQALISDLPLRLHSFVDEAQLYIATLQVGATHQALLASGVHCVTCIYAVSLWRCAAVMLSKIMSACLKLAGNVLLSPYSYGFCISMTLKTSSAVAQTNLCFHVSALQAWWADFRQVCRHL